MLTRLLACIACCVLLMMVSGCLSSSPKTGDGQGNMVAEHQNEDKIKLTLLQFKVEIADQVLAMANDYMAQNPNVIIDAQVLRDYHTTLITRFATGEAPDIFSIRAFTELQDWSIRLADLTDEPWMAFASSSAVRGMTVGDRKLGFPMSFEGYGFIYNKDLFEKAGIIQEPQTISELREANEKLRSADILSYSEGYKEWWIIAQHLFNLPFAYERDPIEFIDLANAGEVGIRDLKYLDGFFDVLDMTLEYGRGADTLGVSYDDQVTAFATGKTAMMQQGVWTIESIRLINPDLRIGMFAIPLSDDPFDAKLPIGVPSYYVINKDSKHLAESKAFLEWLHINGQHYLVDSFKFIPAFTDLTTTEALGPLASDLHQYETAGRTIPWAHTLWPSGSNQEFAKPLQAYVGGGLSRAQTIAGLQKVWDMQLMLAQEVESD